MRNKQQKYKALYEKLIGDCAKKVESVNDLHRLLAAYGLNPTNRYIREQWKDNFAYSDFVVAAESYSDDQNDLKTQLRSKFSSTISRYVITKYLSITTLNYRNDLKSFILQSDSIISAGRMEQFCSDTFGKEDSLPIDRFFNELKNVQTTALDKYLNNVNTTPDNANMTLYPELKLSTDAKKDFDPKLLIINEEPDCTQRGAFFHSDGVGHRFSLNLSTASECCVNLYVDSTDTVLTFLIIRNGKSIEGIGYLLGGVGNPCSGWKGDLPAGDYEVIPFPIIAPKVEGDVTTSWTKLSDKDKHGEIRLTSDSKTAMGKIMSLFDTSGNGRLSKDELKEFQKRTESTDELNDEFDALWETIQQNFNTVNGELTMSGFIAIHEAQLVEGGDEDFQSLFLSTGFSPQLEPIGCCSIKMDVQTPESKSVLIAKPLDHFSKDGLPVILANAEKSQVENIPSTLVFKTLQIDR